MPAMIEATGDDEKVSMMAAALIAPPVLSGEMSKEIESRIFVPKVSALFVANSSSASMISFRICVCGSG